MPTERRWSRQWEAAGVIPLPQSMCGVHSLLAAMRDIEAAPNVKRVGLAWIRTWYSRRDCPPQSLKIVVVVVAVRPLCG